MRIAPATALAILLAGCASAPPRQPPPPSAPPGAPEVRAARVETAPMVDGVANDAAWEGAPEATVIPLHPGSNPLRLKSVVHGGAVYFLVQWEDSTESGNQGSGDAIAVVLPLSGSFFEGPTAFAKDSFDQWYWNAGSTDSSGHAEDSMSDPSRLGGFDEWVAGTGEDPAVTEAGGRSAGDVLAKGGWRGGWWTVEFARALSTGHADDRDLGGLAEVPLRFYLHNGTGKMDQYAYRETPVLRLLLPPPVPEDKQGPFPDPRGAPRERR